MLTVGGFNVGNLPVARVPGLTLQIASPVKPSDLLVVIAAHHAGEPYRSLHGAEKKAVPQ